MYAVDGMLQKEIVRRGVQRVLDIAKFQKKVKMFYYEGASKDEKLCSEKSLEHET